MGSRWDNEKKWNLRLEDEETGEKIDPRLSVIEWKIMLELYKSRTSLIMETKY